MLKRLLIVADHPLVVQAIRLALRQTAGFQVVGLLDGRVSIRAQLLELQPDVVLIDEMQDRAGAMARVEEVAEVLPEVKPLLLIREMDDVVVEAAFDAGADAVLSKAIHSVALGTLLRETVRCNIVHRHRPARSASERSPLTARETEILGLAAQGYTNGRIARQLWITEQTVKFHLSNTYRKLGVTNRTEASRYAYVNDLVMPDAAIAS
jgi:DNA-binding NarL/FixJ family response regulator